MQRFRPDIPPGLSAVIRRMTAKQPEERYQTPADVVAAMLGLEAGPVPPLAIPLAQADQATLSDDPSAKTDEPLVVVDTTRLPYMSSSPLVVVIWLVVVLGLVFATVALFALLLRALKQ